MNEQVRQGPTVPEYMVPPLPINSSRKNRVWIIIFLIIIIAFVVGAWYYFSVNTTSTTPIKEQTNPITFDDSDLKISYAATSSVSENSAPAFGAINSKSVTSADIDSLTKYIASSTAKNLPPITQANKIISAYPALLKAFDENATKPYLCNIGKGENCPLNSTRNMSYLAGVKSLVLFEQNKIAEAQKNASNLVALGKNITANADADITLLVGWVVQKIGYSVSSILNSNSKTPTLSETDKNTLITQLHNEQKKVFKYAYTRVVELIDYISSSDKKPVTQVVSADDESILAEYRKAIAENPNSWNPTETKKYFYDSYKIMISNVEIPCGAAIPESRIETGFNPEDKTSENYMGKKIYSTSYAGVNSLNVKRCEVETAIRNF
jgi:hypothetical protein